MLACSSKTKVLVSSVLPRLSNGLQFLPLAGIRAAQHRTIRIQSLYIHPHGAGCIICCNRLLRVVFRNRQHLHVSAFEQPEPALVPLIVERD